jgi:hypothetical protein
LAHFVRIAGALGVRRPVLGRRSQIDLFGNSQGVVDLYSKVPHRAFQLRVAKQELYRA